MRHIKRTIVKALLLFSISLAAQEASYISGFMEKAPVLDGEVTSDSVWNNLIWAKNFVTFPKCTSAKRKTRFKIGYTDTDLYFAIDCEEPEMDKISVASKDLGPVWNDDSIEIFLLIKQNSYLHLIVNAAGARANILHAMGSKQKQKTLWEWQAKTKTAKHGWTTEIRVPFHLLKISPKTKLKLKFNICRTATPVGELSSWAPQKESFHDIKCFGTLILGGKLSKQQIAELSKEKEKKYTLSKIRELKLKWQLFKQNFSKGDRKNDETFATLNKTKISKINLLFRNSNLPAEQRYQNIASLLRSLEQEAKIFNYKLGQQFINELTNN